MNKFAKWTIPSLAILLSALAVALGQDIPNHAIPIGRGPGVVGFGTGGPCPTGQVLIWSSGAGSDPVCGSPSSTGLTVGSSTISGGTNTRVLFDNNGVLGEYTNVQLTSLIQVATTALSGAVPAWPNNTTTFFRGDGTYASPAFSSLTGSATCAQLPALIGDVTTSAGSCATSYTNILGLSLGGLNANNTASNGGIFYSTATAGNILAGTATANLPLLSGSSTTPSWATITYPTSGTSGGIPYFSSATALTSSALLTNHGVLLGGGAGGSPTSTAVGTSGQLFLGVSASAPNWATMGGDCTVTNSGTMTCLSTNGSVFTAFATQAVPCLISQGCTSQTTAAAARAGSGLNIDELTSPGDVNYTILSTDRTVAHTALTISRTDTLPAANSVNAGMHIFEADINGVASASNTITIQRAGSDTVNGGTNVVINSTRGGQDCVSNGSNAWFCSSLGSGAIAGVSTVNGQNGAVTVVAGTDITVSASAGNVTVNQVPDYGFRNCTITASVNSNNLTIALKDNAGNDPQSSSPCSVWYRNFGSAASSAWTEVSTTAALSFTANSGSTFGVGNNAATCLAASSCPFKLWVVAINSGSGNVIGVVDLTNASGVRALNEGAQITSTACNACGNATAIGTIYSTAAQSTKAFKILGYCEWNAGLATAGTYASTATSCQTLGPGIKRPGDIVQTLLATVINSQTSVTSTSYSTAISQAITPTMASNLIRIRGAGSIAEGPSLSFGFTAIANGTTIIGATARMFGTSTGQIAPGGGLAWDAPGSTSTQTYNWRVRGDGTNAARLCDSSGSDGAGCTLEVEEIMGALSKPIPANDNERLRKAA